MARAAVTAPGHTGRCFGRRRCSNSDWGKSPDCRRTVDHPGLDLALCSNRCWRGTPAESRGTRRCTRLRTRRSCWGPWRGWRSRSRISSRWTCSDTCRCGTRRSSIAECGRMTCPTLDRQMPRADSTTRRARPTRHRLTPGRRRAGRSGRSPGVSSVRRSGDHPRLHPQRCYGRTRRGHGAGRIRPQIVPAKLSLHRTGFRRRSRPQIPAPTSVPLDAVASGAGAASTDGTAWATMGRFRMGRKEGWARWR